MNGGTPTPEPGNWDGDVPWVTPVDLGRVNGAFVHATERTLTLAGAMSGSTIAPAGSVILSTRAPIGYAAIAEVATAFNQGCKALIPRAAVDSRYLRYAVEATLQELISLGRGSTFTELNSADLASHKVPRASFDLQLQIADYLDRETAEIAAFIADLRLMAELTRERFSSLLAAEVAGPYPKVNIRRVADMRTGHTPSRSIAEYWTDTDIPWFTLADVWQLRQGAQFLGETKECISALGLANSAAELLPVGTVVLSRTASVGFTGIMPRPMATSQDFWNWVCGPQISPAYLWYQFRAMKPEFDRLKSGSTHKTIYQADAAALRVPVPPREVQAEIVGKLARVESETQDELADIEAAIALAQERRAALITAAVTGQIDVTARQKPVVDSIQTAIEEAR